VNILDWVFYKLNMFFIVSFMLFYTVVLVRNIFYNLTDFICFIFIKINQCKVVYFE